VGTIDDITWYALGMMLTGGGLVWSYLRYQKYGLAAGLRAAAWSLLPLALALTRTLKLAGQIIEDIGSWATHLVFSPVVWLGIVLGGVSVVLFGASAVIGRRQSGKGAGKSTSGTKASLPAESGRKSATPIDDDMADIEAILRKHGIQ
jgi:hypothetical protein